MVSKSRRVFQQYLRKEQELAIDYGDDVPKEKRGKFQTKLIGTAQIMRVDVHEADENNKPIFRYVIRIPNVTKGPFSLDILMPQGEVGTISVSINGKVDLITSE
jgi:hypothetical protein